MIRNWPSARGAADRRGVEAVNETAAITAHPTALVADRKF
jgi:hypothetical protein